MQLDQQTAVITGASSGIGEATARRLGAAGARLALVGRDQQRLDAIARDLAASGARALTIATDLTDDDAPREIVRRTNDELGEIEILVHSAGIYRRGPLATSPIEDFDAQWRVNARAPYALTQAALADLTPGGRVVMITSKAGRVGLPDRAAYGASKAAAELLVQALAAELAPAGVRVNGVAPGFTATPMNAHLREDETLVRFIEGITPARRLGTPEEIADAVMFLVSEASSYVHGHTVCVDGGYPSTPSSPPPA